MWKNLFLFILVMLLISGCKTEELITVTQKEKHTELIRVDLHAETNSREKEYLVFHAIDDGVREYILFVPVNNLRTTNNKPIEKIKNHTALPISSEATNEFLNILDNNIQLWGQETSEDGEIISSYNYTSAFETRPITDCGFKGCNKTPGYTAFKTLHIVDPDLPALRYNYSYSENGSSSSLKIIWEKAVWDIDFDDKKSLIMLRNLLMNAMESISNNSIANSAWLFEKQREYMLSGQAFTYSDL